MNLKKFVYIIVFLVIIFFVGKKVTAREIPLEVYPSVIPQRLTIGGCDPRLVDYYTSKNEVCVQSYTEWLANPEDRHLWVFDAEVTALGKASDRARQFIYWVINKKTVDNHPVIMNIWKTTRNVVYFFLILIASIMGLGMIVSRKTTFGLKIQVWPSIFKLLGLLLYVTLSAAIVLSIIQLSDITMQFFIENLGGRDVFNTYFVSQSQERNYTEFIGYRDLNLKVQESIQAEMFMIKATNITYYVMGIMLILRRIILWFLLFVSPFLAILAPFVFIRNIGWIWVGVFFQWVFYGPLFALFFGALSSIWKSGIPYPFDFSRINSLIGHVYPTAMNITYGGPAQVNAASINPLNSGNYVDTFVEYVISLVMLWTVVFFPWWLLRIFRDYCCDGIYAMKNILMSMYDQARNRPQPSPKTPPTMPSTNIGSALNMPTQTSASTRIKLETIEQVKRSTTEEISRSLNLKHSNITDIARFETSRQNREEVIKNINYLSNPTKAETPNERQKFMNIRTELFNRVVKEDKTASQILTSISSSKVEQMQKREEIIKSIPHAVPTTNLVSYKVSLPQEKISSVNTNISKSLSTNTNFINNVSQTTNTPTTQVQTVLQSFSKNISGPPIQITNNIAKETGIAKTEVKKLLKHIMFAFKPSDTIATEIALTTNIPISKIQSIIAFYLQNSTLKSEEQIINEVCLQTNLPKEVVGEILKKITTNFKLKKEAKKIVKEIAEKENISENEVEKVLEAQIPLVAETEKNIEQTIAIPPTISLEDYEEVKKMWSQQYEKGEVPVTENIKSREEWCEQDIILITNTLNKLVSPDKELNQEGLDDLGYILPVFLINNLKGEELIVYLKAKLEAAKSVESDLEKEKEITEKLKSQSEEQLVDVSKSKTAEKEKTMEMKQEMEIKPEVKNNTQENSAPPKTDQITQPKQ